MNRSFRACFKIWSGPVFAQKARWLGVTCLLAAALQPALPVCAATDSTDLLVNKWNRFEQSFQSAVPYPNPLADITLTVAFISPLGETTKVYGFWDGGETWRVRFSPDLP